MGKYKYLKSHLCHEAAGYDTHFRCYLLEDRNFNS